MYMKEEWTAGIYREQQVVMKVMKKNYMEDDEYENDRRISMIQKWSFNVWQKY